MISELLYAAKRPWHFIKTGLLRALPAQIANHFPEKKLTFITITGTDGKTTSSTLLYHVLTQAGYKAALISTVGCYIGTKEIDTGLHVTSPDPVQLFNLLSQMVQEKVEYVVLEVTSHGAYQFRTWGIHPSIAGLTNISHEHLDYHLTMNQYIKAKALILRKADTVVLNKDDENYHKVRRLLPQNNTHILTYSLTDRLAPQVSGAIKQRFQAPYNWENARLVYQIARQLQISHTDFINALKDFPGIPGRMQEIPTTKRFRVIVDFAHTPQGLEAVLTALRSQLNKKNKLIAVYGAAGLRDRNKRPLMGKIGAQLADLVVYTAEDPRTEDVWSIIRQLKQNVSQELDHVVSIADRGQAIEFALNELAGPGDIVAILGKGHEKSMCYGTTEYHWSDVEIVQRILDGKELGELIALH